ncbi:serine hydrolase domain-containing protein [Mesoflavibacter zeaxanthinifaciens]|uniref:serine hydrolase domain-containing protein n=1 Tax=Mesoflavibacter zeaxanthinifaciens TaxID=393060 RepID=UPI003A8DD735
MKKSKTKRILRITLLIGTIITLYFVPWTLLKAWILPLSNNVQEEVNEAMKFGYDGMIVYVDEAGKPPAFYSTGWKDKKNKIPADPHSLFKIASNSKLYVAVAITKLVKDNRLSLDKTLAEYFPELIGKIENADKITLRLMIQHRSGIPNFTDSPNYWKHPPESSKEKLDLILNLPANFVPDEDYEYSNTNYLLLSKLIEKVVGYNKFQYIKEEILIPLNLNKTFSSLSEVNLDDVMSGYHIGHPYDLKTDDHGMLATAEDLGIFLRALNDGSVFNEGEQEIYSSIYKYNHAGWVPGYQSFSEYYEDIDTIVILFNNTTDPKLYMWNLSEIIMNRIVKILRNKQK